MRFRKKQACVDCHFLMKQSNPAKFHVSVQDRTSLRQGEYSWAANWSLGCYMGVWDEGYGSPESSRLQTIVETERRGFCFFWQFRPGMFFPAGEVLQKRESESAEAKRDRRLTIIGLWIAALALVAEFILSLLTEGQ